MGRFDDRRRAREAALQMLYYWAVGRVSPEEAMAAYWSLQEPPPPEAVRARAEALVRATIDRLAEIDRLIAGAAERWRPERMAIVDRLILRLATGELLDPEGAPPAVVIDEALELARRFSGEEAVRFVNGVLDTIRRDLARQTAG
ncbi:MAG TPA: transcription antitermination factor NusB [Vicinamibacterales bacterium]|nr:transcription antitermination factor NusB [Vicinamibacterales bacterium]